MPVKILTLKPFASCPCCQGKGEVLADLCPCVTAQLPKDGQHYEIILDLRDTPLFQGLAAPERTAT